MGDANRAETRARLNSPGEFGQWGSSVVHERYLVPLSSTSRRRCSCGCGTRSTYGGTANGLGLTSGCELSMRRWVRTGRRDLFP